MARMTVGLAELPETPHFLYRLYDRTDALLYIGITNDPKARFKSHRRLKQWWGDVDHEKTRIAVYPARDLALEAEEKAIANENPLYNEQHNLTVDTPAALNAQAAVREFADMVLHLVCIGRDGREQALRDADEAIRQAAEDPEEYGVYSTDRFQQAAITTAETAVGDALRFRNSLDLLLDMLPEDQVKRCRQEAIDELVDEDEEPETRDVIFWTVTNIAHELAADYLDTLPEVEAAGWRLAARSFLRDGATDLTVNYHAARYAKAVKADRYYSPADKLCMHSEWHRAKCHREAVLNVHLADCRHCENGSCAGHRIWCSKHLDEVGNGETFWGGTKQPIVITHTSEPEPADDPWKVPF